MPDARRIFLTGATGFLGSHLARALLEAGHRVTALARRSDSMSGRERVVEAVTRVSGAPRDADALRRLRVVEGDLSSPRLGLDPAMLAELARTTDEIWHSAASLSFLEDDREEIFRMNVDGTRRVLEFASGIPTRRLHHISTAYVAGSRTGIVRERELEAGQEFRNPYEESKCEAEIMLRAAHAREAVVATVYRPSIVIGNSATGEATHFHGVYAFIRGLWAVARRLRQDHPGSETVDLPLRIRGSETSTLNFVPVDFVTDAAMAVREQDSSAGRTFHLTNPEATPNKLWLDIVCRQIGVRGLRLVGEDSFTEEPMTRMEMLFHRQMTFFSPYLSTEPTFDRSDVGPALEPTPVRCPQVTPEFAAKMTGWYIDLLNGTPGSPPR